MLHDAADGSVYQHTVWEIDCVVGETAAESIRRLGRPHGLCWSLSIKKLSAKISYLPEGLPFLNGTKATYSLSAVQVICHAKR